MGRDRIVPIPVRNFYSVRMINIDHITDNVICGLHLHILQMKDRYRLVCYLCHFGSPRPCIILPSISLVSIGDKVSASAR